MAKSQRQRVPGSRRVLRRLHRRRRAPSRCTSSPSAALPWLACARTPGAGTEPFSSMRPHMTCTIPRQSAATRKRTSAVSAGCTRVAASPCWLPPEHRCKITLYVCTCIDVPCDTHDTSGRLSTRERTWPAGAAKHLRLCSTKQRQGSFDISALRCERAVARVRRQRTHTHVKCKQRACAQTSMLRRVNAAVLWLPCAGEGARCAGEQEAPAQSKPPPACARPPCCVAAACSGPWPWGQSCHGVECPSAPSSAPLPARRRRTWRCPQRRAASTSAFSPDQATATRAV